MAEISDADLLRLMVGELGVPVTIRLLGFVLLWGVAGCRTYQDLEGKAAWSPVSEWRAMRDLRQVRARLVAEGYLAPVGDGRADRRVEEREMVDRLLRVRVGGAVV